MEESFFLFFFFFRPNKNIMIDRNMRILISLIE